MKRNLWIITVVIASIIVIAVVVLVFRQNTPSVTKIAIVSSLTGDLAENGKDTANGAKMAFDEANSKNAGKQKISYEMYDDQGDPKTAVSIANRICEDKSIIAVVGHLTSGSMSAAAQVYYKAGMPVVMPVPTNPTITKQGYNNLFRIPPTDDDQAPFLARYLIKRDPKVNVAVVNDLTAYGIGFAEAFRNTYESNGKKVVAFESAQKQTRDYRALISKIKSTKPAYVIIGATYDMGAPFVRQMKELGVNAIVMSGDGCYGSAYTNQAGKAAEGTIVSFIAPDRASSPATQQFFTEYEKKYGKVVSFAPLGYDAAKVVAEALKECSNPSRKAINEVLQKPDFSITGVTGIIQFDKNGDNKNKNLTLYVVRNGNFELLP